MSFMEVFLVRVVIPVAGVALFFWGIIDGPIGLSVVGLVAVVVAVIFWLLPPEYEFFSSSREREEL